MEELDHLKKVGVWDCIKALECVWYVQVSQSMKTLKTRRRKNSILLGSHDCSIQYTVSPLSHLQDFVCYDWGPFCLQPHLYHHSLLQPSLQDLSHQIFRLCPQPVQKHFVCIISTKNSFSLVKALLSTIFFFLFYFTYLKIIYICKFKGELYFLIQSVTKYNF